MAFTTYAELQTSIADFLARDDLTAYIPDYITLFECDAARKMRVRLQETTATLTPSSGVATIPTDYLGHRRVTWTGTPIHELTYVTPSLYSAYIDSGSGTPVVYTIEGSNLRVAPSDDTDLTFDYYQKTAAVSGALNWLFTNHPDAYLAGSLAQAAAFNKDFDKAGLWKGRADEIMRDISLLDFNERQGMAVRVYGLTP